MYQTTYYTNGDFNATSARIERTMYYRGRYWTTYAMPTIYSPAGAAQWHTLARSVYVGNHKYGDDYRKYYPSRKIPTEGISVVPAPMSVYHMGNHYYLPTV